MQLENSTQYIEISVLSIIFSCVNNKPLRCLKNMLFCYNKILIFKQLMAFFLQEARGRLS